MGESFDQIFINFGLAEGITACYLSHQIHNVNYLSVVEVSLCVVLA